MSDTEQVAKTSPDERFAELEAKLDEFRHNNISLLKEKEARDAELAKYRQEAEERRQAAEKAAAEALAATKDADVVRETYEAKIQEIQANSQQRAETLQSQLNELLVEQSARASLEKAEMHVDLALPHVVGRAKLVERDGRQTAVVFDGDRPMLNEDGSEMSVPQYVAAMRENPTYAPFVRTKAAKGGGAAEPGAGGVTVKSKADFKSTEDKVAWIGTHGAEAYAKLPNSIE